LTERRLREADPAIAASIDFDAGLRLTDVSGKEQLLALYCPGSAVAQAKTAVPGGVRCVRDELPERAAVTVIVSAASWAGVLSGRRGLDALLAAGELAFEGRPELAIELRKLLDL